MTDKPAYRNANIHYVTGTGNTRRVALWLCDALRAVGSSVSLHQISSNRKDLNPPEPNSLTVIATPTHGFTAPWPAIWFALSCPLGKGSAAGIFATRGASKLGGFYLPGMEGTAAYLLALILFVKNYRIRFCRAFDMPSNWITIHPGYSPNSAQDLIERTKRKADAAFAILARGDSHFRGFLPLLLGLLLLPVSLAYILIGRFLLAKIFHANLRCISCGLCEKSCPFAAIKLRGKGSRPYWSLSCESCMRCTSICPTHAIEASVPIGVLMVYCAWLPYALFGITIGFVEHLYDPQFAGAIYYGGGYLWRLFVFLFVNMVLWLLMGARPIRWFLSVISPTHYWRKYREPNTTADDLIVK